MCQDFAHLAVACLRSVGLACRYVSGYLATDPPPGKERMIGVDASHAWAAVRLADGSWLGFDPTNDTLADERYTDGRLGPRLRRRAAAARGDLHRRREQRDGRLGGCRAAARLTSICCAVTPIAFWHPRPGTLGRPSQTMAPAGVVGCPTLDRATALSWTRLACDHLEN